MMNKQQQYSELLDKLLADVDMNDDVAKKKAHIRCLDHAQAEMDNDPDVNLFLAMAAERLGQLRIHLTIIKSIVPLPEEARLHLIYSPQGGPVLTGNSSGLRYLGDLCAVLSEAPPLSSSSPAEHVHLYQNEPPMFGYTHGLTLYNESDEWLDQHAVGPEDDNSEENADEADCTRREIDATHVAALEFLEDGPFPPYLLLSFDKLYRIRTHRPHSEGDEVWARPLTDGSCERMFVYTIEDDSGAEFEVALHLDDQKIRYFTYNNLKQVLIA